MYLEPVLLCQITERLHTVTILFIDIFCCIRMQIIMKVSLILKVLQFLYFICVVDV
jgi:hypothetical protein